MKGDAGSVLVVDDLAEQRDIYRTILAHAGLRVFEAKDGESALRLARGQAPEVVLLDVCLPDVDGFEVARRLKADPATSAIPIVMLTAGPVEDGEPDDPAAWDEFLSKPVQPRDVLAAVQRHLRPTPVGGHAA
jgi:two-component system, cell cycle response regulator